VGSRIRIIDSSTTIVGALRTTSWPICSSGMSDGLDLTFPVLVTISSVSGTRGAMFKSRATSDASIVMLDPVSSQKLYTLPLILTGISGVPTAETDIGSTIDCERKLSVFGGTFLNASAHNSMLARSVRSAVVWDGSLWSRASASHLS